MNGEKQTLFHIKVKSSVHPSLEHTLEINLQCYEKMPTEKPYKIQQQMQKLKMKKKQIKVNFDNFIFFVFFFEILQIEPVFQFLLTYFQMNVSLELQFSPRRILIQTTKNSHQKSQ